MRLARQLATAGMLAVGAVLLPGAARALAAPPAPKLINCSAYHAGRSLGGGRYSHGAMLTARDIACGRALALVRPHYGWVIARERRARARRKLRFHLGRFRCRLEPGGSHVLVHCAAGKASFAFV